MKITRIYISSLLIGILFLGGSWGLRPQDKVEVEDLAPRFRDFLDLTSYIMLAPEKDVFMQLQADRDREAFIRTFWKQRDPTPGTPQNEYREEHIRRFNHANTVLARQTPRQGWMTDMGRYYIILGEPTSYERMPSSLDLYPVEIWYYHGDTSKGLPTYFALVFFKRGGVGEYKLYDPLTDTPTALMVYGRNFDLDNYEDMFDYIRERSPTLALVSLSMIPGDIPYNFVPSAQNNIMLADIIESPKKDVNPSYATHFLEYKGMVSVDYMENFVESSTELAVIRDPLMDINFLHFAMVPEEISIDYYEPKNQYFCNYSLTVNIKEGERIIFQYTREFPFYFSEQDLDRIRGNGIAIEDSFPLVAGQHQLTILLQNSVGKEFSIFEDVITVPEDSGAAWMMKPILGYRLQNFRRDRHIPFKVLEQKVVVDPKNTFGLNEDIAFLLNVTNLTRPLWEGGRIRVEVKGLKPVNPTIKSFDLPLKNHPFHRTLAVSHVVAGDELPPDYYEMSLFLVDSQDRTLDQKKANFTVSPESVLAHPIANSKAFPLSSSYLFHFALARQAEELQDWVRAETLYQQAFEANPELKQGLVDYANFLFKIEKFDQSLQLIERLRDDEEMRFQYLLVKGRALMGKGLYPDAIDSLLEGNKLYNSDTGLLNSLGICYLRIGENQQALDALKASLTLNPGQDDIKELVAEIEKKNRDGVNRPGNRDRVRN
jgi:GWxTD domain-containing protein